MTGAEAAKRDANTREQGANQERRLREAQALTFEPPEPLLRHSLRPQPSASSEDEEEEDKEEEEEDKEEEEEEKEEEEEEKEEEEAVDEALMPPPSTAPAALQVSRAGRKRAPTMKALEAEAAPKRGNRQGRGRGGGGGNRGTK